MDDSKKAVANEDDKLFWEALAEDRHKQLIKVITESKPDNSQLLFALESQSLAIKGFVEAVKKIHFPKPEVNVEVNQKEVIVLFTKMSDDILRSFEELNEAITLLNQPRAWDFVIKRNNGYIESVRATMEYIKPKFQA